MRLPEKVMLRRYHALDYDWTPLSRNPCWLSNAAHHYSIYMKRNRFAWFHLRYYRQRFCEYHKLRCCSDKSFADDLVESGYCKCESSLVLRSTEIFPALLRFVLPWFLITNVLIEVLLRMLPCVLWLTITLCKVTLLTITFTLCKVRSLIGDHTM